MVKRAPLRSKEVQQFVHTVFAGDVHAKRVLSLANATLGAGSAATRDRLARRASADVSFPSGGTMKGRPRLR